MFFKKSWFKSFTLIELSIVLFIIAMMSTGVSFKRLMKPYMISAAVIALLTFVLGAYVIPKGNVKRVKFENTYKRKRVTTFATNVQLEVDTGVVALIQRYEDRNKMGYSFQLDKFRNKYAEWCGESFLFSGRDVYMDGGITYLPHYMLPLI